MSLLVVFLTVILIIIIIARLASKTRPEHEREPASESRGFYSIKKIESEVKDNVIEALMCLLVKKGLVTEEEILSELELIIEEKKET